MTAGEYAARYGHRITPDEYAGRPQYHGGYGRGYGRDVDGGTNHHYRARRWDDAQDKTLRLDPSVSHRSLARAQSAARWWRAHQTSHHF